MFLDASAIVAIVALEPGHQALVERLDSAVKSQTSPLAMFEAALAIGRDHTLVPRHRGFDGLICSHFRRGRFSGAMRSSMLRGTPG